MARIEMSAPAGNPPQRPVPNRAPMASTQPQGPRHTNQAVRPQQATQEQPVVPQNTKTFVRPEYRPVSETDSRYISVGLPSGFFFNSFKKLSIRPFNIGDLKKVFRAGTSTTGDLNSLVEAVGAVIDQPVMDLTVGDWWSLMYWLRFNSYKKNNPLLCRFTCDNEDHIEKVNEGKMKEETLANSEVVVQGNVEPIHLNQEEAAKAMQAFKMEYGFDLDAPRVASFVEAFEYRRDYPEDTVTNEFSFRYAICLPASCGATLVDRVKWLESQNIAPDVMSEMEKFINVIDHGVKESVTLTCKGCGASKERPLSIDALSFFPEV